LTGTAASSGATGAASAASICSGVACAMDGVPCAAWAACSALGALLPPVMAFSSEPNWAWEGSARQVSAARARVGLKYCMNGPRI